MFPKLGGKPPKWTVNIMENPIKMDDFGVPHFFWKHPNTFRLLVNAAFTKLCFSRFLFSKKKRKLMNDFPHFFKKKHMTPVFSRPVFCTQFSCQKKTTGFVQVRSPPPSQQDDPSFRLPGFLLGGWAPRTDVSGQDHTPIYKPLKMPFGRGPTTRSLGGRLAITMVINHVSKSWDDPPSGELFTCQGDELQAHMHPCTMGTHNLHFSFLHPPAQAQRPIPLLTGRKPAKSPEFPVHRYKIWAPTIVINGALTPLIGVK